MTQNEMVLKYIKDKGSITAVEAVQDLGVYRLSARIADLEASGHKIMRQRESSKNRYNKTVNFARYSLMKGKE